MDEHEHSIHEATPSPSFWQSSTGLTLIVFLVIAALIKAKNHSP